MRFSAIKHIVCVFLLAGNVCLLRAQSLSFVPASFVDIGFGARPVAMGGAFTAVTNDVNAMMWNPAGLASLQNKQAAFTYTNQLGLVVYQYAGVAIPLGSNERALGVAFITSGDKALKELTLQATYAQSITQGLKFGATAKYRNASFGNNTLNADDYVVFDPDEVSEGLANQVKGSANGFGFDVGLIYILSAGVTFGLSAKDVYAPVLWDSRTASSTAQTKGKYTESLPVEVVVGSSARVIHGLIVDADFVPAVSTTTSSKLRAGTELRLVNIVSLRAGMQQYLNNDTKATYAFGIGITAPVAKKFGLLLDYTYVLEQLAATQRLSLGVEF
jgi:hypothetical protein